MTKSESRQREKGAARRTLTLVPARGHEIAYPTLFRASDGASSAVPRKNVGLLKILHLTDLFTPSIGGMETHVLELVRERHRRGHTMSVVTLQMIDGPSEDIEDSGYRVYRIPGGYQKFSGGWSSSAKPYHPPAPDPVVAREIRRIIEIEKPDIVHAHNWIVYSYLAIKSKSSPPVLWMQHDYSLACPKKTSLYFKGDGVCPGPSLHTCFPCSIPQYGIAKGAAITLGLFASNATLARRVDRVVANSTPVAHLSESAARLSHHVDVVPSFVTGNQLITAKHPEKPEWLPPSGYILYVGSLGVHKGIFELLKAYDRLTGTVPPLVVLGTPKDDMPTVWPKGSVVRLNVPHDEVLAAWGHCGFGVIPSVWPEPFGLVALEAGVMEKAVVASKVGGLADIVTDDVNGLLVPPRDVSRLAGAMQRLIDDKELRDRLGRGGREHAVEFTISRMTDRLDAICEEVVAQHS